MDKEQEKKRRVVHRKRKVARDKAEKNLVLDFKKLVGIADMKGCDQDMLKCSTCGKSMGLKKWARLATQDMITCPGCGAAAKVGTVVKTQVVRKEKSRFKVTNVEPVKSSVEVRPDGSRLIKEEIHVTAKSVAKQNKQN